MGYSEDVLAGNGSAASDFVQTLQSQIDIPNCFVSLVCTLPHLHCAFDTCYGYSRDLTTVIHTSPREWRALGVFGLDASARHTFVLDRYSAQSLFTAYHFADRTTHR